MSYKQENEQLKEDIKRAEDTIERLREDRKLLVLKEQSMEMELVHHLCYVETSQETAQLEYLTCQVSVKYQHEQSTGSE